MDASEITRLLNLVWDKRDIILAALVSSAASILATQWLSLAFGQMGRIRDERRARRRKVLDLIISTYNEMANDFTSTCLQSQPSQFEAQARRMVRDKTYFPLLTLHREQLYVFDNLIKKESGLIPVALSGPIAAFYQTSLHVLAMIIDSRSPDVAKLATDRRIIYVGNLFEAYGEHIAKSCQTLLAVERWIDAYNQAEKADRITYFDLGLVVERFEIALPSQDLAHITTRWIAYLKIAKAAADENVRRAAIRTDVLSGLDRRFDDVHERVHELETFASL